MNNFISKLIKAAVLSAVVISLFWWGSKETVICITKYLKELHNIEKKMVQNIPIYGDFATPEKEKRLRTFLQQDHMRMAVKYGVKNINSKSQIPALLASNKLTELRKDADRPYYFYNVPAELQYLTPAGAAGLELVANRFQHNIKSKNVHKEVKIAVSSVLRPIEYQKKLTKRNYNAKIVSTHSYGLSFDIFYDDFFIHFPEAGSSIYFPETLRTYIKNRLGYVTGDALRRQFRAVLMETLLQLQAEGKLYAIHEKRQRCYHITIIPQNN